MSATTIELPSELLADVERIAQESGFASRDDFVRWALEDKLRELRRERFYQITDRAKQGLAERGNTAEEVLEDFERFRRG